jgi:D-arabinose 1-dehydrogenase-like Zn-dependent alcohol dehydrogenase
MAKPMLRRASDQLPAKQCPSSVCIAQFETNLLREPQAAQVRAHISSCGNCQEDLSSLREFTQRTAKPATLPS